MSPPPDPHLAAPPSPALLQHGVRLQPAVPHAAALRPAHGGRGAGERLGRGQWVFGGGSCNGVPPAWGARGSSLCPPAPLCPPSAAARASRRTRAATPPRCCAGGEAAAPEPPPRGGDPKTGPHHKRGLRGAPPFWWDPPIPVASSTWELGLLPGPSAPSPAVLEGRWGSAPGPGSAAGPPPGGSAPHFPGAVSRNKCPPHPRVLHPRRLPPAPLPPPPRSRHLGDPHGAQTPCPKEPHGETEARRIFLCPPPPAYPGPLRAVRARGPPCFLPSLFPKQALAPSPRSCQVKYLVCRSRKQK